MKASELHERIILMEASDKACHRRVDSVEKTQESILAEMKEITAWMNQVKGWIAAGIAIGGAFGGIASWLLNYLIKP